jgi:hypothetical protein
MTTPLYDGSGQLPAPPVALRAGPLALLYDDGRLRQIRLGDIEVLLMIYAAVRDQDWNTIAGRLLDEQIEAGPDSFRITYRSEHIQDDVDFVWDGVLTGAPDGTITFSFDGEARAAFRRNRIGFCVLHPMSCAGQDCTVITVDGGQRAGRFPQEIAPHQPFKGLRAITHTVAPGVAAQVLMEGDTFEMEDQRNWTDASFKTYCTPLELPFPVTIEPGTRVTQTITLRLSATAQAQAAAPSGPLTVSVGRDRAGTLPPLGLGMATHGQPLSADDSARLRALNLSHLRADLRLNTPGWEAALRRAAADAGAAGAALEIAAHVSDHAADELAALRALADELAAPVARWLVFHMAEKSTRAQWVRLGRAALASYGGGTPVGAGTNNFFTELNRERPPVDDVDFVVYSLNPQVHAFDNTSLIENLAAQTVTVTSARAFSGGKPVVVSPVTLKMRSNPNATAPAAAAAPDTMPPSVDPRQMSLLGAGWTLGSIAALAAGGAASLTYYETTGWLGVMETAAGAPAPDKFPSIPGAAFPMYHVFADLGAFAGGELLAVTVSDSRQTGGLAVVRDGRLRLLLANFTPSTQTVMVRGLSGTVTVTTLDETSAERAMRHPDAFRASPGQPVRADSPGGLPLVLLPYAVVRLDGDTL